MGQHWKTFPEWYNKLVAISVVVSKGFQSFCITVLADQPTRRLGSKPDKNHLQDRGY